MAIANAQFGSNAAVVEEIIIDATVDALNTALKKHDIPPDRILAVHYLEGDYIANGSGPRYRVLYWM